MNDLALDVDELSKTYDGVVALDRLSFQVRRGEIFGLLGPNGAGKTTTIRVLLDLIPPDSGRVLLLGEPPGSARERIGYLPEERGLYGDLRVDACLTYLGELKGMKQTHARQRALELLARVALADWARKKVKTLSRGMLQKVQILASLIHDPDLVILDEPFQGLDPINVVAVKEMIQELQARGKTVVLSAHEMSQVEALCDRLVLVNRGRAVLYGALTDIRKQFSPNAVAISPPLPLDGWPGVLRVDVRERRQTVYLTPETSPRAFLKMLLDHNADIERFEIVEPTLEQIFVTAVKEQKHVA